MLIKHKDWIGRSTESTVSAYVDKSLSQCLDHGGIAEDARHVAGQVSEGLGRLVERLAEKGLLNGRDITYIADGYEKDAELTS